MEIMVQCLECDEPKGMPQYPEIMSIYSFLKLRQPQRRRMYRIIMSHIIALPHAS